MRVDFYEMSGRFKDPLFVAGVLVSRAWPASAPVVIVGDRNQLRQLDEQLWAEPNGRFLPHGMDDEVAPIRLLEAAPDTAAVLINLDPRAPLPGGLFERVLEIVPPEESLKHPLRERWKAWKQKGAELHHHVLR